MSLSEQLGYRHDPPNAPQRWFRAFASSRPGAWVFAKTARHVDRAIARMRPGHTAPEVLAGLEMIWVTTTGARSGAARRSPLLGIPHGDAIALVGTNFGQAATPNWYYNLRAHPHAQVQYHDRIVPVVAREAEGAERDEILRAAAAVYRGYDAYGRRITGRTIPVMVLEAEH